jgi:hypothetical protein
VKTPRLDSLGLAYETGLHIGDGCLSHFLPYGYRYSISGNLSKEEEYYREVVVPLIQDLYGLTPTIYCYHNSFYATVWSKALVLFKSEEIGLPVGIKDQLKHLPASIPEQGTANTAALLAGQYDADGSVKVRKTSSGDYPRISLAQKTRSVVAEVQSLLSTIFGISSTMYRNEYFDIRVHKAEVRWFIDINGYPNFRKFVDKIGTRHPAVLRRMAAFGSY